MVLRLEPTHLVVEVVDSSPRLPRVRHYAVDATTGRGIKIINSFSATWGSRRTPEGKVVWAHIRPDEPDMLTLIEHPDAAVDAADQHAAPAQQLEDTRHQHGVKAVQDAA